MILYIRMLSEEMAFVLGRFLRHKIAVVHSALLLNERAKGDLNCHDWRSATLQIPLCFQLCYSCHWPQNCQKSVHIHSLAA